MGYRAHAKLEQRAAELSAKIDLRIGELSAKVDHRFGAFSAEFAHQQVVQLRWIMSGLVAVVVSLIALTFRH